MYRELQAGQDPMGHFGSITTVYLAGPMRGYEEFNYPLFNAVTGQLRRVGYEVFNPAETDAKVQERAEVADNPLAVYMEQDLADVARADAVFVLPGWEASEGATIEVTVAAMLKKPVYALPTFEQIVILPAKEHPGDKATNPKDAIGSTKLPLHLWPASATVYGCLGLLEGMLKYGRANWREAGVRATIYIDALGRHIAAYAEGQDLAPDSGLPHLAHALACIAILVDADATGKLIDDRQYNGAGYLALVEKMTPEVARLTEQYADRNPKHYTIQDNEGAS